MRDEVPYTGNKIKIRVVVKKIFKIFPFDGGYLLRSLIQSKVFDEFFADALCGVSGERSVKFFRNLDSEILKCSEIRLRCSGSVSTITPSISKSTAFKGIVLSFQQI